MKWPIAALALIIIVYMSTVAFGFFLTEPQKKPIVADRIDDYGYLWEFYTSSQPMIEGRGFFGSQDARITVIVYTDPTSSVSRQYVGETLPMIMQDYVNSGKARYYPRIFLTTEDYSQKTERFIYAKALNCVYQAQDDAYGFYKGLHNLPGTGSLLELAEANGVAREEFAACMEKEVFEDMLEDVSQVENFGISITPRFYIGMEGTDNTVIDGIIPYRQFQRAVKDYQTRLGD